MGSAGWKGWRGGEEKKKGRKGDFSTFYGKLKNPLSDFTQERDLLSKKVLISHSCFCSRATLSTKPESIVTLMKNRL